MDLDGFWQIIEWSRERAPDFDAQAAVLREVLRALTPEEMVAFDRHYRALVEAADTEGVEGLWGEVSGVGADDGFSDFRHLLVARGREFYEAVLSEPARAAAWFPEGDDTDAGLAFTCLAHDPYEEKTGRPMP